MPFQELTYCFVARVCQLLCACLIHTGMAAAIARRQQRSRLLGPQAGVSGVTSPSRQYPARRGHEADGNGARHEELGERGSREGDQELEGRLRILLGVLERERRGREEEKRRREELEVELEEAQVLGPGYKSPFCFFQHGNATF